MARIGIMGGTFNPIHNGHIRLADTAYKEFNLDRVWFMPSKIPPHKDNSTIVDEQHRVKMISLAIKDYDYFTLSELELKREGTTYTSYTLEYLKDVYPNDEFFFIVGADSIFNIESWNRPTVLFKLTHFIVACRDDIDYKQLEEQCRYLQMKYDAKINIIHMEKMDISSSYIRQMYCNKIKLDDFNYYIDKRVNDYILSEKLYSN